LISPCFPYFNVSVLLCQGYAKKALVVISFTAAFASKPYKKSLLQNNRL